jgi:hypothetical protein
MQLTPAPEAADESVYLQRADGRAGGDWHVLAPPGADVRVNGLPLRVGMRRLRDRDEILLRGAASGRADTPAAARMFFSTERLAMVVVFPEGKKTTRCARCKQPILPGSDAVQCPAETCLHWHHQSDELPCWTYAERCAMCDQPTQLDADYRWTPEDL